MVTPTTEQAPIPPELLRRIRRIEVRARRLVDHLFLGQYHSVFRGRGLEFSEVREYQPGDDVRIIDWNVTARMGTPYVKKFVEERELTVYLVVDVSASEDFSTGPQTKAELAAEIGALLSLAAVRNNDRVGLIAFTDRVESFLAPRKGRKHVLRVVRELLYLPVRQAGVRPRSRGTDIGVALGFLSRIGRRRSVAFLLSDFLATDYEAALRVAARRHDIIAISLGDPREAALPNVGLLELEDRETGQRVVVDSGDAKVRQRYAEAAERRRQERRRLLSAVGVDEVPILTSQPYVQPLMAFFAARARRP